MRSLKNFLGNQSTLTLSSNEFNLTNITGIENLIAVVPSLNCQPILIISYDLARAIMNGIEARARKGQYHTERFLFNSASYLTWNFRYF